MISPQVVPSSPVARKITNNGSTAAAIGAMRVEMIQNATWSLPRKWLRATGLLGTTWGLIVAYLTFNLPFAIWIMNAFFAELPKSLEEAAMVDGASRWMSFRRIALPLALPGVATTAILCLVFSWNDYAFASTFSGPDSQTLPIAASQLVTQTEIDWGQLTAIGTIVVAPMIVVGLVVRRWLVTGLTLGAVTGE